MTKGALAVIIGGLATQAVAILCWYAAFVWFDFDLLKLWFNLILPFGALMLGFVGGCGFWFAGRALKMPSTLGLKLAATAIAVCSVVAIRYLGYWMLEFQGVPIHDFISFGDYMNETLGHARMNLTHGLQSTGTLELGAIGYLMEAVQIAAFALSSFGFAAKLPPAIRCDSCDVQMDETQSGTLLYGNQDQFRAIHEGLASGGADRLAGLRAAPSEGDASAGTIRLSWRLAECPGCNNAALTEAGALHNGSYFAPLGVLARETRFVRGRVAPPRPPEMPVMGAPRTFGRRTVS